jgi:hypothetical protein
MKTFKETDSLKIILIYLQRTFVTETNLAERQTRARWRTSKVEKSLIDSDEAHKLTVPIKMYEQLPLSLKTLTRITARNVFILLLVIILLLKKYLKLSCYINVIILRVSGNYIASLRSLFITFIRTPGKVSSLFPPLLGVLQDFTMGALLCVPISTEQISDSSTFGVTNVSKHIPLSRHVTSANNI